MKKGILILSDVLHSEGAENVAVNIAVGLKDSNEYTPIVCTTRRGGVLEKVLKDNDVKYISLGRNHSYEAHKFLPLKQIIKEENVKIIHAHKLGSNFWGSILGSLFKIPVISHSHGGHAPANSRRNYYNLLEGKLVGKLSYKIIAISEYERRRLIEEEGILPSKIITIYNGIESSKYKIKPNLDIKRQLDIKTDSPVVGIIAAFRPQKNHELFLLAAREVLKENRNVYFLLVGDGVTRERMEKLASELAITKNCLFTGVREDIPDIISIIDVGVLSSHWEGLPLAVLEYMASCKPVISTNVSALSELVQDNINGFLVPPGDYEMLAQKMSLLLDNKDLALEMGRNGFSIVKESFTAESMIKRIEDLYTEILANGSLRV